MLKIVPDWRSAWRWFSVQLVALAATVQLSILAFPFEIRAWLGDDITHWLAVVLLFAAILGRLIDQKKPETNG